MNPVAKIYYLSVSADVLAAFRLGDEDLSELQRKSLVVAIERLRLKSLNNKEAANSLISEAKKYGGLGEYLQKYFAIDKGTIKPNPQTFSPDLNRDIYQKESRNKGPKDDSDYYLLATEELDKGERKEGVWAKAMVLSEGDTDKARYRYINLRVEQLSIEDREASDVLTPDPSSDIASTSNDTVTVSKAEMEDSGENNLSFINASLKLASFFAKQHRIDADLLNELLAAEYIKGKKIDGDWYVDVGHHAWKELIGLSSVSKFARETKQKESDVLKKIESGKYKGKSINGRYYLDKAHTKFPFEFSVSEYSAITGIGMYELLMQLDSREREGRRIGPALWEIAYDSLDFQKVEQAEDRAEIDPRSNLPATNSQEETSFIERMESLGQRGLGDDQRRENKKNSASADYNSDAFKDAEEVSALSQFLRGDPGLPRMFWIFGVLVSLVSTVALVIAVDAGATPIALGIVILDSIYRPLLLIGIWRAAKVYSGLQAWATLARVLVVFGWIGYVGGVFGFLGKFGYL